MEDGFDLLMSTTFKSVLQKFYFSEFGKNATIENPMTGGKEEVKCVAGRKSWTCFHYHQGQNSIYYITIYTFGQNMLENSGSNKYTVGTSYLISDRLI